MYNTRSCESGCQSALTVLAPVSGVSGTSAVAAVGLIGVDAFTVMEAAAVIVAAAFVDICARRKEGLTLCIGWAHS